MGIIERYKVMEKFSDEHYLVRDEASGVVCYLKILDHYEIPVFEYLRRFKNEHVVRICDYEERDGRLYVFEEYISGETFHDLLLKNVLSEEKKRDILVQICDGLHFLHIASRPIIHRDLKPQNIIITNDGIAKIIDYDIAKVYKRGQDRDTTLLGTYDYAAPEQYGFSQSDPRTDIYALGKIIEQITNEPNLLNIAKKATQMDPKNRYKNIDEMKYALLHPKPTLWPPPGFRRRVWWHILIAILYWCIAAYFIIGLAVRNFDDWTLKKQIFYDIENCITFAIPVDIFFGWTGFFERHIFSFRKKNTAVFIITGIVMIIIQIILINIINHTAQEVWLNR
ncbi:MAG: serine/threonine protein kinase [Clostridiales bacterium]|nr:serine/threonine protein kinase [Clostridiales bacterium]